MGSLIFSRKIGKTLPSFLLFKRSALAKLILFKPRNSLNSESELSLGTPFTAKLLVCLLIWKALGRLTFTFWPSAAFILVSFCKIITSCIESLMIRKSPFGSSLIWETLRPGWNCLNSPSSLRQFLSSALIPLIMTEMLFLMELVWDGLEFLEVVQKSQSSAGSEALVNPWLHASCACE